MTIANAQTTTQLQADQVADGAAVRVLGLTILYHPDLERVGERAVPVSSAAFELSRNQPEFAPPGQPARRPLGHTSISRQPIVCCPGDRPGSLMMDPGGSRTSLEVDGRVCTSPVVVAAADIERGVVIVLANQIVLLLHMLDPLTRTDVPRWGLVGESPALLRACRDVQQLSDLEVPVLIRGETGTGKELMARAIHQASQRSHGPYLAVNMAAIPPSLAASELFGAVKGAYTGAKTARAGYFRRAHGGTLFLDEIGEMPTEVQVLLLRALETGEIQPVGADRAHAVDVRLLSATDADLERAIADGRFRGPVVHRLAGYVIQLPALRDRREDFGRLFVHFLRAEAETLGQAHRLANQDRPWVPAQLFARLARWHWPGNVRQLRNVIRQLVIAHRDADQMAMLPALAALTQTSAERPSASRAPDETSARTEQPAAAPLAQRPRQPRDISEDELVRVLRAHEWRLQASAQALGISRPALYALIRKSDRLRTAAELDPDELAASHAHHGGDTRAMARALEVSEKALRRRLAKLGLPLG